MAEYIEREKTISKVRRCRFSGKNLDGHEISFNDGVYEAAVTIEKIPTADVRPERHGEWIDKTQWYGHLGRILTQCSECGFEIEGDPTSRNTGMGGKYCENCGAKMNGKPKRLRDITKKNGKGEE